MRWRFIVVRLAVLLVVLCMAVIVMSAASNQFMPSHSQLIDRLSDQETARLQEALHLRNSLGSTIWTGWGEADIPLLVYNEEYAFLIGRQDPVAGWIKVPQNVSRGGQWELVPDDLFGDQVYYRQRLEGGIIPESFTVMVGNHWAASLATRERFQISLGTSFRDSTSPIFPYRIIGRWLAGSSDRYITLVLHESFHAYQGITVPDRLARAEKLVAYEKQYPWSNPKLRSDWQNELNVLAAAVTAADDHEAKRLANEFLVQRDARRSGSSLGSTSIEYEQQREWLEGLAKYTEMTMWRRAAASRTYVSLSALGGDGDFKSYSEAEDRWLQEVNQIKFIGNQLGDMTFYYSGMAQAALLDRLAPGWQAKALTGEITLEELLRSAD